MDFFTSVDIPEAGFRVDYKSNIVFIGSCFAENISKRFARSKFNILVNPLGVIYNPLSIENQVKRTASNKPYSTSDLFFDGEKWNCFEAHSSLSVYGNENQEQCVTALNSAIQNSHDFFEKADTVFITLGSAFVYFLKSSGKVVSNCHKQKAELFERRLISVDEAAVALENIIRQFCKKNTKIVFTVSPLRHLNDGAHGNNLSKATLQLAIEKVVSKYPSASYFPSFEIVMDELRDYRFYAEDMTHLTPTAEEYIFERMVETYCDTATIANMKRVEKFMKTASHRIENTASERTKDFARQQIERAENLEHMIDGLDLSEEKEYFRKFI